MRKGEGESTPRVYLRRSPRNSVAYLLADSGCEQATKYLGKQSLCLECPFSECQIDTPYKGRKAKLAASDLTNKNK